MVGTNFGNHFFVTLNTPMGTDIISVDPALSNIFLAIVSLESKGTEGTRNESLK
jgi:hypothetical protein